MFICAPAKYYDNEIEYVVGIENLWEVGCEMVKG